MIKGGVGGANTNVTGLQFERETSLAVALEAAGFEIEGKKILRGDKSHVGLLMGKSQIYNFLDAEGVDWRHIVSSKLLPDEACLSLASQKLTVVEKKWQETPGSVDEKLQTCGFKLRQYSRLFSPLMIEVKYVYLLNDWFTHPRYQDVLDYIKEVGADYHFKSLPLDLLEL
jgi:hypothetical protein